MKISALKTTNRPYLSEVGLPFLDIAMQIFLIQVKILSFKFQRAGGTLYSFIIHFGLYTRRKVWVGLIKITEHAVGNVFAHML